MHEIDTAVDKLFGPYLDKEENDPGTTQSDNNPTSINDDEVDHIRQLTTNMTKHLNLAIKSKNWWKRLYYSHQFLVESINISKILTRR